MSQTDDNLDLPRRMYEAVQCKDHGSAFATCLERVADVTPLGGPPSLYGVNIEALDRAGCAAVVMEP